MRFATYLKEAKSSTLVTSFGRMNPPTTGHKKLIDRVQQVARSYSADWSIFLSHSSDPKKNPLKPKRKLFWLRKMFPTVAKHIQLDNKVKTFIDLAHKADGKYDKLVVVAGDDRLKDYQRILDRYNGREFNFESIEVVSAGRRDPNATGVEGMSASKLRKLAKEGDFDQFKMGVPLPEKESFKLYSELRDEMGVT